MLYSRATAAVQVQKAARRQSARNAARNPEERAEAANRARAAHRARSPRRKLMSASVISRIQRAGKMKRHAPATISSQASRLGARSARAKATVVGASPVA